ncbi:oxidoreductase-like protein [Lophiostoma macrostomum CBS 122681]|uniref:Oxidoreductase-like protein n=1 Tax=Lophiostoma macrostomum CBS 122681 TaxID=1314788 RepID=A0A6A6SVC3_9PLEO|nr:oxidoreductase-like protein [Lophiostoma macrostomum CBS 122681]
MSQDPGQELQNNGKNFVPTIHNDTYPSIDSSKTDLSGKYVLITGASKGIGRAAAISYARAGASGIALGARSSLADVATAVKSAAKSVGKPEPKVVTLNLDIADRASVTAAAEQVSEAFDGKLDILVNNAGFLSPWKKLGETDPDLWWTDWEVNVKGLYLMTHAFLPLVLKSSHKVIINVASVGAHILGDGASSYQTSKLAVLRLCEFLQKEHGEEGLLVHGVQPGSVKTELALGGIPEAFHELLNDTVELGGDAFVWLSKERRDWLAGRYFNVAWDVDELEKKKDDIVKHELLKVRMAVTPFPS